MERNLYDLSSLLENIKENMKEYKRFYEIKTDYRGANISSGIIYNGLYNFNINLKDYIMVNRVNKEYTMFGIINGNEMKLKKDFHLDFNIENIKIDLIEFPDNILYLLINDKYEIKISEGQIVVINNKGISKFDPKRKTVFLISKEDIDKPEALILFNRYSNYYEKIEKYEKVNGINIKEIFDKFADKNILIYYKETGKIYILSFYR